MVGIAGCSSEPGPATLPDISDTSSVTPQPTTSAAATTPVVDPTAALEAEITAFFQEYIDTVNASWTSEEALARSEEMFSPTCGSCSYVFSLAERAHAEGLSYEGQLGQLEDVRFDSFADGIAVVSVTTSSEVAQLVDSDGAVIEEFSQTDHLQVIYQAAQTDGGWIIIKDEVIA